MLRRLVVLVLLVSGSGLAAFGLSGPAAAAVTTSHITTPSDGAHYLLTDTVLSSTVTVSGTSDGAPGDLVDVRCYYNAYLAYGVATGVPVGDGGSFSTTMQTQRPYGTCVLRAVPHGLPYGASTAAFTGPRVTGERIETDRVASGPNAGKAYDFYVLFQSADAMNDYQSATSGGFIDSRLSYPNGYSSSYLWYGSAALPGDEWGTRSYLQVDGRNAYGPYSAHGAFPDNRGLPELTYSASRDATTGITTIHEVDPIVVCPSTTFPPTAASCPQFDSAGVRLERTITADDGGLQVHITDVWRSADGDAHTVSAHYDNLAQGYQPQAGATSVGLKLPWVDDAYYTAITELDFPGPTTAPASLFVRDDNDAPDGDTMSPRGAITFDVAPLHVHRHGNVEFTLWDEGIEVPAGGTRTVRQKYVIGSTEAEIAAKAPTLDQQSQPTGAPRPDGLISKGVSAYVGNGIYNPTGAGQAVTATKRRGKKAAFSIAVQNDGTVADAFRIAGPGHRKGFAVRYFAGSQDVTAQVTHGTFTVSLGPGQQQVIRLVVKVKATARKGILRAWLVTARAVHDSTSTDTVRANVRVAKR